VSISTRVIDLCISEFDSQDGRYETQIIDHLAYDGFGNITSETTPANQPAFTYTGRRNDRLKDRGAENAIQRGLNWYNSRQNNGG
jgi:hypothetical protein